MSFGHSSSSQKSKTGPAFEQQRSAFGNTLFNQGEGVFGPVTATETGLLNNPVTPEEQNALTQTAMQPVASSFNAAANRNTERAATSRNPAGLLSVNDQLARQGAEAQSEAAEKALLAGMDVGDKRRAQAASTLANLYGIDMGTMAKLLSGQQGTSSGSSGGFNFGIVG
jgi:hypothetical protein